jgi:predicted HTH transcriptional regulator
MHKPIEVFNHSESYIDFLTNPDLERLYGQYFDWKEVPKPYNKDKSQSGLIECVSSFANSNKDGGLLILGIADDATVKGVEHLTEEHRNSLLDLPNQKLRHVSVQCKNLSIGGHQVVLMYVPHQERNICQSNDANPRAWKRQGAQAIPFRQEDWEYFRNLKNPGAWEAQPCAVYEERFLDKPLFEEFKQGWLEGNETATAYSIVDVLENAGALVKHQGEWWYTNAGFLFFCGNPQRLFPSAYVRFLKYDTKLQDRPNPGNTVGENEFKGALPVMVRKIRDWVREANWFKRFTYRAADGFSFAHEDEYPLIAVGEAIVNAVVHRDYALQTPIDCCSYTDAFQVHNAGGILQNQQTLPGKFELGTVEIRSYARNPKMAEWFRKMPDEEGKPFVRRLSEGTKRMVLEMQRMSLSMPRYQTNGDTMLTFFNNIEERSKRFFTPDSPIRSANEYLNLFAIHFTENTEGYDKGILRKEILSVLKDNLQTNGWYIDRYSKGRLTVHQRGDFIPLGNPVAEKVCNIFRAYVLQVKVLDGNFYLAIDYKAELKNLIRLDKLLEEFRRDMQQSGIVQYHGKWENCFIRHVKNQTAIVYLVDFDTEVEVGLEAVLPNLGMAQIQQNLISHQVGSFNLHNKLKEASLLTVPNAAIERARLTLRAARAVADLGALKFNGYKFTTDAQPVFLLTGAKTISPTAISPVFSIFHDLQEPQVSFGNKHQSVNILEGLNKYGAYDTSPKTITIVPVCTMAERQQMADLIQRLQIGKHKYEGSERTFGVRLIYETIYTTPTHEEIEQECERIVHQHPAWEGDSSLSRIFLVSVPDNKYALDDHSSPYFGIKQFLLERGIPCQMVDTPTLQNPDWKDLNLSLNLVGKCGLVPWVLSERLPEAECFIGMAYTTTRNSRNREKLMGFVSVFDEYGKWRFYKGDSVFLFEKKKEYFSKLIPETLRELTNLPENARIHLHTASRFSREDEQTILMAAQKVMPKARFSFVWLNDTHILRGYDNGNVNGSLSRGSYVKLSQKQLLLSTTGYNQFKKSMGTPRMVEAVIHTVGEIDLKLYAKHLLSLTKLNWASTNALTGEPITTKYASNIAYLTEKFIQRKGDFKLHKVLERTPWFI